MKPAQFLGEARRPGALSETETETSSRGEPHLGFTTFSMSTASPPHRCSTPEAHKKAPSRSDLLYLVQAI